jgi:heptosyltransferase-2
VTLALDIYQPNPGTYSCPSPIDLSPIDWRSGMLIRSTNWLGDALMSLPGVYRLRRLVPAGWTTTVLAPAKLAALWSSVPWIDRVITFADKRLSSTERQAVRQADPGVTVVLPNSFGAAWDVWRSGAGMIVGRSGRGRGVLLDAPLPAWSRVAGQDEFHEVRKYLEIAIACGSCDWNTDFPSLEPNLTDQERAAVDAMLPTDQPLLVLAPGAAYGPAKQWPVAYFNAVARWWTESRGGRVIACGAPGEEDVAAAATEGCSGAVSIAGKTSLAQLMYVMSRSDCVVANDSGAMHLAAALGCSGVALFGSTDPIATGPIGGRWVARHQRLPCAPCLQRSCPRSDVPYECLKTISPQDVIECIEFL